MVRGQLASPILTGGLVQKTLNSSIVCSGIGLHSGHPVTMTLRPAGVNTGIRFVRTDIAGSDKARDIAADWQSVVDTRLCTVLGNADGVTVSTVEHLMAALAGCGIDNLLIELNGPEVPIMDGSALPFVALIERAGITAQAAARRAIRVIKPVEVRDGDRRVSVTPASTISFSFEIDFPDAAVARQEGYIRLANGAFKSDLAQARTFGFMRDVEMLRANGFALGGSLDNAIVVDEGKIVNAEGLRYGDEFVRHKVLDAVGDLYLAGAPILGHFHGVRSGHALNNQLLHALMADDSAWFYDNAPADQSHAGWVSGLAEAGLARTA